jgi:hypothetical protein
MQAAAEALRARRQTIALMLTGQNGDYEIHQLRALLTIHMLGSKSTDEAKFLSQQTSISNQYHARHL